MYVLQLASALCLVASWGAASGVTRTALITVSGEITLSNESFPSIDDKTFKKLLQQVRNYLASETGLQSVNLDSVTASFSLINGSMQANYSWTVEVYSSDGYLNLTNLSAIGVADIRLNVVPPVACWIDSTTAIVVIVALGCAVLLSMGSLIVVLCRSKCKKSKEGNTMEGALGDDGSLFMECSYHESVGGNAGSVNVASDAPVDEANMIRAWVQAQLRESQAAKQQNKKPRRFSFRLIGKTMDHFDSGVVSTTKSCKMYDDDSLAMRSPSVTSLGDAGGSYTNYGTQLATTENLHVNSESRRAPIYKKNPPKRVAAATSFSEKDPSGNNTEGREREVWVNASLTSPPTSDKPGLDAPGCSGYLGPCDGQEDGIRSEAGTHKIFFTPISPSSAHIDTTNNVYEKDADEIDLSDASIERDKAVRNADARSESSSMECCHL